MQIDPNALRELCTSNLLCIWPSLQLMLFGPLLSEGLFQNMSMRMELPQEDRLSRVAVTTGLRPPVPHYRCSREPSSFQTLACLSADKRLFWVAGDQMTQNLPGGENVTRMETKHAYYFQRHSVFSDWQWKKFSKWYWIQTFSVHSITFVFLLYILLRKENGFRKKHMGNSQLRQ